MSKSNVVKKKKKSVYFSSLLIVYEYGRCHGVISRSLCVRDSGTAGPQAHWPEKGGGDVGGMSTIYGPVWLSTVTNGVVDLWTHALRKGEGKERERVVRLEMGLNNITAAMI